MILHMPPDPDVRPLETSSTLVQLVEMRYRHVYGHYRRLDMALVSTDDSTWPWAVPTSQHGLGQNRRLNMALVSTNTSTLPWSVPTP